MSQLSRALAGVIPPVATPLCEDGELDAEGVQQLVEHLLAGGVHGLFVLGTTGESASLSAQVRRQMIERTSESLQGRLPLLAGVTDTSLTESLDLAHAAHSAGADGVVLAPPFYLPIGADQLETYVRRFAEHCPLPVVLYNIPSCTKTAFDLDTVRRLSALPNVVAVKDSSGDMEFFRLLLDEFAGNEDFAVLIGPEDRLAEAVLAGADGGVCGGANVFPELFVAIYHAAVAGEQARAEALQATSRRLIDEVYRIGPNWPTSVMQGIKAALEVRGICRRHTAPPIEPLSDAETDQVRAALQQLAPQIAAQRV